MKLLNKSLVLAALLTTANVNAACSISTNGMSFGSYIETNQEMTQGFSTISVNCDAVSSLVNNLSNEGNIRVNLGTGNGNSFNRYMLNFKGDKLFYNIYLNPNATNVFGDGTFGTSSIISRLNIASSKNFTVYGGIPKSQKVSAGSYSDVITITLLP